MILGVVCSSGSGGLCRCGAASGWEEKSTAPVAGASGWCSLRASRFSPRKQKYRPATRAAARRIVSELTGIKNAFTGFFRVRRVAVLRIRKDCENDTEKAPEAAYGGNEARLLSRQEKLAFLRDADGAGFQNFYDCLHGGVDFGVGVVEMRGEADSGFGTPVDHDV